MSNKTSKKNLKKTLKEKYASHRTWSRGHHCARQSIESGRARRDLCLARGDGGHLRQVSSASVAGLTGAGCHQSCLLLNQLWVQWSVLEFKKQNIIVLKSRSNLKTVLPFSLWSHCQNWGPHGGMRKIKPLTAKCKDLQIFQNGRVYTSRNQARRITNNTRVITYILT